jgi:hypothetical protein
VRRKVPPHHLPRRDSTVTVNSLPPSSSISRSVRAASRFDRRASLNAGCRRWSSPAGARRPLPQATAQLRSIPRRGLGMPVDLPPLDEIAAGLRLRHERPDDASGGGGCAWACSPTGPQASSPALSERGQLGVASGDEELACVHGRPPSGMTADRPLALPGTTELWQSAAASHRNAASTSSGVGTGPSRDSPPASR